MRRYGLAVRVYSKKRGLGSEKDPLGSPPVNGLGGGDPVLGRLGAVAMVLLLSIAANAPIAAGPGCADVADVSGDHASCGRTDAGATSAPDPAPVASRERGSGSMRGAAPGPWPQYGGSRGRTFEAPATPRGMVEPLVKWDAGGEDTGVSALLLNLSPNAREGPVAGLFPVTVQGSEVVALDPWRGVRVWSYASEWSLTGAPAAADYDGDGRIELAIPNTAGALEVVEPSVRMENGTFVPERAGEPERVIELGFSVVDAPLLATDVVGSDAPDVAVCGPGYVAVVDVAAGSVAWTQPLAGQVVYGAVALAYSAEETRIVVASTNLTPEGYAPYTLTAFTSSGAKAWTWTAPLTAGAIPQTVTRLPTPASADVDPSVTGDEVVAVVPFQEGTARVALLRWNGSLIWVSRPGSLWGQADAGCALADVNGDGVRDIAVATWRLPAGTLDPETAVAILDGGTGEVDWQTDWDTSTALPLTLERTLTPPAFHDADLDGVPDVLVQTTPELAAFSGSDGSLIWSLTAKGSLMGTALALSDADGDGFTDVSLGRVMVTHNIVDLAASGSDLSVSPAHPVQWSEATVSVIVHNTAAGTARDVVVDLYEGGTKVGSANVAQIPGYDSREASLTWTPQTGGDVILSAVIDPADNIEELDEANNRVNVTVYVTPLLPDLLARSIRLFRADGAEIAGSLRPVSGESTRVEVLFSNWGERGTGNVTVRMEVTGQPPVARSVRFDPGQDFILTADLVLDEGPLAVRAVADPEGAIEDANRTNNVLVRTGEVKGPEPVGPYAIDGTVLDGGEPDLTLTLAVRGSARPIPVVDGRFSTTLQPHEYQDGDIVELHWENGTHRVRAQFAVYSEDIGRTLALALELVPFPGAVLSANRSQSSVKPGEVVEVAFEVINSGNQWDTFTLNATLAGSTAGSPGWALSLEPSVLSLPPGGEAISILTVSVPHDAAYAEWAETHVGLVSELGASAGSTVRFDVVRVYAVALRVDGHLPLRGTPGVATPFTLVIVNEGNAPETFELEWTAPPSWRVTLGAVPRTGPGAASEVSCEVEVPPDASQGVYDVNVTARHSGNRANATTTIPVEVRRPDLAVTAVDLSGDRRKGAELALSVHIANLGHENASATQVLWQARCGAIEEVQTAPLGPLAAGRSHTIHLRWTPRRRGTTPSRSSSTRTTSSRRCPRRTTSTRWTS